MEKLVIGPSTGWMYANNINLLLHQKTILEKAGANAVEFCLGDNLEHSDLRVMSLLNRERFPFIFERDWQPKRYYGSIHLPSYQPSNDRKAQAKTARQIASRQGALIMLIHPLRCNGEYPVGYYEQLNPEDYQGARIRLAIENMDKNKPDGFLLSELENLVQDYDLAFVLDVQHAFEHDISMAYANDLFEAMYSHRRLAHLHVSGEAKGSNHCLLHRAENASAIVEFLGKVFSATNVPIILEGEYKNVEELGTEIEFITKEIGIEW